MPKTKPSSYREELQRLALAAFEEARKKRNEAAALDEKGRKLRAVSAGIDQQKPGPLGSLGWRRSQARVMFDYPFRAALARRGWSVPDWARQQRDPPISVETAKSWLKVKTPRPRQCPEFWAKKIEKEFMIPGKKISEVPAVDASWPHGIKRS